MSAISEATDTAQEPVSRFARQAREAAESGPAWLRQLRQDALDSFLEVGFPTTRHEEWKYTNVTPFLGTAYEPAGAASRSLTRADLERLAFEGLEGPELVFVNGRFAPDLSRPDALPGVRVVSLAEALARDADALEPHLSRYARPRPNAFTALNTASFVDGALVWVPRGVVVERPIHLLHVSAAGGGPVVSHPRSLILLEESAQATLVESFVSAGGGDAFTNTVTEAVVGESAVLDHYRAVLESEATLHVSTLEVRQERSSVYRSHVALLGGALVRNGIGALLGGEGVECTLNGLYVGGGRQVLDTHTLIEHARPHCNSFEVYKGILDGRSRGVFNGKIYVRQDAQKTDAKQTNQNLLLSEEAEVDAKPQLEIFADDVRCTHGATVGQLDEEAVFYLRSRGIPKDLARGLLIRAFANDILNGIRVEPVKSQIEARLRARLPGSTQ